MTYARGQHPNSKPALAKGRTASVNPRKRYSYVTLAKMTAYMRNRGQFTISSLAKYAKVSWHSANRWVCANHAAGNLYVSGWERSINYRIGGRIFTWGEGVDVPKPERMSGAVLKRRTRLKKATGPYRDLIVASPKKPEKLACNR